MLLRVCHLILLTLLEVQEQRQPGKVEEALAADLAFSR